ncbi:hypothetical protein PVAP13_8KG164404 [Panicum virgatum]|uniref:Uncharacterized protein n=1 Tax=Panicum virgatum TaxID=38727 RepID=A0A8T0PMV1_PANVG|nr:hypothetical protein PVAP13_8KG164404 [Panicum virgatum]
MHFSPNTGHTQFFWLFFHMQSRLWVPHVDACSTLGMGVQCATSRKGHFNIRKILTHTWLNFGENDTVGKHAEFGIGMIPSPEHPEFVIGSTTVDSNQVRQQWILHQHAYPDSHIHSLVFVIEDLLFLHLGGYVFPSGFYC